MTFSKKQIVLCTASVIFCLANNMQAMKPEDHPLAGLEKSRKFSNGAEKKKARQELIQLEKTIKILHDGTAIETGDEKNTISLTKKGPISPHVGPQIVSENRKKILHYENSLKKIWPKVFKNIFAETEPTNQLYFVPHFFKPSDSGKLENEKIFETLSKAFPIYENENPLLSLGLMVEVEKDLKKIEE